MNLIQIKIISGSVDQFNVVEERRAKLLPDKCIYRFHIISLDFSGANPVLPSVGIGEGENLSGFPIVNTFKILTATDGPVNRIGADAEFVFQLLHQLVGITGFPVHFVDEGKNRDIPHGTDLEKLSGLGLDAFGCIQHHDGRVGSHQGAVSILREILVSRGIENVDAVTLIFKLKNRAGDGNTSLFFQIHPVRHGMAAGGFPFYGSGGLNRPAVEKKLFRQRGLTGVRMRNNGECSSASDFFFQVWHKVPPKT